MKKIRYIILVIILSINLSCGDDSGIPAEPVAPDAVDLEFPENNTQCNEGKIISDLKSEVTFKWSSALHADSYTLKIKNLHTGSYQNINSDLNEATVSISRGTAFSWSVISNASESTQTAESNTWKFYNAGLPVENYTPFPAELLSPLMRARLNEATVSLSWEGSDLDNDIASYDVLLDTYDPPTTVVGNYSDNTVSVAVSANQIYYWQVITKDEHGNTSDSDIFQFETLSLNAGMNLVQDGAMNNENKWTLTQLWNNSDNAIEHGFENGAYKFKGAAETTFSNAILWQEIEVELGKTYNFNMMVKGDGTINSWLEVYFGKEPVASGADDYLSGGAQIYIKSFGDNEDCAIEAFDGDIFSVASGGCPIPSTSLLDANGNVTFSAADVSANNTIFLGFKAGNYDGNFGPGIFIDDVTLKEVP